MKTHLLPFALLPGLISGCYILNGSESGIHYCQGDFDCLIGYTCLKNHCYQACTENANCPNYRPDFSNSCNNILSDCPGTEICLDNGYCQFFHAGELTPKNIDLFNGNNSTGDNEGYGNNDQNNSGNEDSGNSNHDDNSSFTCVSDSQCIAGQWCTNGKCGTTPKGNGQSCRDSQHCQSGYCIEGICCDTACNHEATCSGDMLLTYTCEGGTCHSASTSCGDYTCANNVCKKGCYSHSDCADKRYCVQTEQQKYYNMAGTCGTTITCGNDNDCPGNQTCDHYAFSSYYSSTGACRD